MGIRGLLSSVFHRDKKDRAQPKRGSGQAEAEPQASLQPQSASPATTLAADPEENGTASKPEHAADPARLTGRRKAGSSIHRSSRGSSAQEAQVESPPAGDGAAVAPPTGLRKPSGEPRRPSPEHLAAPSEYLYFGDGSPPAHNITGHARTGSSSSSAKSGKGTRAGPSAPAAAPYDATGNDGSGFPTTAMSSSQTAMGYQHLTYSGSVQYDYTGGHGQGAFASAGSHGSAAFGY